MTRSRDGEDNPDGESAKVGCAVFLASDDASFVTGSELVVDGDYTALELSRCIRT
jgi:hypothetical protein